MFKGHETTRADDKGRLKVPSVFRSPLESKYGRVSVLDKDGRVLARWGTPKAEAPGSFAAPHGLAVDSGGAIYVAEVTHTFAVSRGHAREDCHTFQKFSLKA